MTIPLPFPWLPDAADWQDLAARTQANIESIATFDAAAVPTGTAGGDLGGSYPSPTVLKAQAGFQVGGVPVARKYAAAVGDGTTDPWPVNHNLGTRDLIVQVYDAVSFDTVDDNLYTAVRTTTNRVDLDFGTAAASNAYRVVIHA